jgi:hypothetical protein
LVDSPLIEEYQAKIRALNREPNPDHMALDPIVFAKFEISDHKVFVNPL